MKDKQTESPSALDQLVGDLSHSGKSQYSGVLFAVPTRLQADLYGMVEALTQHAGTSRNKIMNQLVQVGIEATLDALPNEIVTQLNKRAGEVISTAIQKNTDLESGDL